MTDFPRGRSADFLSAQHSFGKLLRAPLRLLPPGLVLPILAGRLRGSWWISGSSLHSCWMGTFEYRKRRLFEEMVQPGQIVYDLGAHAGYYTLLSARLVGPAGRVLAFEPVPEHISHLRRHLRLNRVRNVTVWEAAVGSRDGETGFTRAPNGWSGHLCAGGEMRVTAVSLDHLIHQDLIPEPDHIKIDVEGAEIEVLEGARAILGRRRPTLFLALHSDAIRSQAIPLLGSLGYNLRPIDCGRVQEAMEILAWTGPAG